MRSAFTGACKNICSVMEYFDSQLPYMRRNQSFVSHNAENRGLSKELQTTTGTAQTTTTLSIQEITSKGICLNHVKISFVYVT
jgi:hypothetical protein